MKKSLLLVATTVLLTACGSKNTDTTADSAADAAPAAVTEAPSADTDTPNQAAAKAADAKDIIGFSTDDLKFDGIIADIKVGQVNNGNEVSIIVVPEAAVDANFNAFSKALFDKIKATAGKVGDDMKQERTAPFETTGGISVGVYSYTIDGHDVYCSISNTAGETGKDYELIFTKH